MKIDRTNPYVSNWSPASPVWTNQVQTFTVDCNDDLSGCKQTSYSCNTSLVNGATCNMNNIQDNAGNIITATSPAAKIDTDAPNCSVVLVPSVWVDESDTVEAVANCSDKSANANSGQSGCKDTTLRYELKTATTYTFTVEDVAGNKTTCLESPIPKIHYVEIRGRQSSKVDPSLKQNLTSTIRQNVANLTRNETANMDNNTLNYNLQNSSVAYYQGDVDLNGFNVSGKKTIIVE